MNSNTEMKMNCGICGGENDRTKNGKPCMEIDGKGVCLKCFINASNEDCEEFGNEEEDTTNTTNEVHNICFQCSTELTDETGCFEDKDELFCEFCFKPDGYCYECFNSL
jgi:hypothetical protein